MINARKVALAKNVVSAYLNCQDLQRKLGHALPLPLRLLLSASSCPEFSASHCEYEIYGIGALDLLVRIALLARVGEYVK